MVSGRSLFFSIILIAFIALVSCQTTNESAQKQGTSAGAETVAKLAPDEQLVNIKAELKTVKAELAEQGEYNCCIQPTCDWCALQEGECPCYDNLKAGKPVCPGCGLGWHNGQGVVQGVKASEVKWDITHEHPGAGHEH